MPERAVGSEQPTTYNLLFVCTGNTCRSPMAAAIAKHELQQRGWNHVAVQSAGTGAATGMSASPETDAVLKEHGIDLADHCSQLLDAELVRWADLILVMSLSHMYTVNDLGGGEKVALITDFLEGDELGSGVDDPFGAGVDAYRRTYRQLAQAVKGLMARLEPILSP